MSTELETMISKLTQPFPKSAIKQRPGGRKMLDYVEGHSVINRLNEATGNKWDFRVIRLDLGDKIAIATVEISIEGLGTRQHIGVQVTQANGSEDLVKGAITDALKKAATLFGVGIELYGPDYEAHEPQAPVRQPRPQTAQPTPLVYVAPQARTGQEQALLNVVTPLLQSLTVGDRRTILDDFAATHGQRNINLMDGKQLTALRNSIEAFLKLTPTESGEDDPFETLVGNAPETAVTA